MSPRKRALLNRISLNLEDEVDMTRTTVALYARVSTRDKGQDTENQLRQLREFCAKQDWHIAGEYVDSATGKNSDREQFRQLFQAASQKAFDAVLFWSLDRFSREGVLVTLQHLQRLTSYGVAYRSFTEAYLDSCGMFKDAVISILATIAKQERIRLSERTIAGLNRARANGRVGGRPRIIVNREKLLSLRRAGCSLADIATQLKLSKTTVARIVAGSTCSSRPLGSALHSFPKRNKLIGYVPIVLGNGSTKAIDFKFGGFHVHHRHFRRRTT
jgi:DNA invertase Pin-like site-specific DNA recombinase